MSIEVKVCPFCGKESLVAYEAPENKEYKCADCSYEHLVSITNAAMPVNNLANIKFYHNEAAHTLTFPPEYQFCDVEHAIEEAEHINGVEKIDAVWYNSLTKQAYTIQSKLPRL